MVVEHRQIDQREVIPEPGAPDHIGHLHRPGLSNDGQAVPDPGYSGHGLHPGPSQISALGSDQRGGMGEKSGSRLAPDGRHRLHELLPEQMEPLRARLCHVEAQHLDHARRHRHMNGAAQALLA